MPWVAAPGLDAAGVEGCGDGAECYVAVALEVCDDSGQICGVMVSVARHGLSERLSALSGAVQGCGAVLLPSLTPRALSAASASLVRREMTSRFCWATRDMMPTIRSLASDLSTARKRTPLLRRVRRKTALRLRRSSLAMISVAPVSLARCRAAASSGRVSLPPLSTSVNRAMTSAWRDTAKSPIALHCASRPRPDRPCRAVETRS